MTTFKFLAILLLATIVLVACSSGNNSGGGSPSANNSPPITLPDTDYINLAWQSNPSDEQIAGYAVHYGNAPDLLHNSVTVLSTDLYEPLNDLHLNASGVYYFAVQAYDNTGHFSLLSDIVAINIQIP
jgi:hypothetical protein